MKFQNAGNFGWVMLDGIQTISNTDQDFDVSVVYGLIMTDGAYQSDLIATDAHLFFQFPEGAFKRIGIFRSEVTAWQCHMVAPEVTFALRLLDGQNMRVLKIEQQQK